MTPPSPLGRALVFAFAAAACYGLIPTLFRAGYDAGIPAVESALVRTTLMIAATGGYAAFRRESLAVPRAAWPALGVQALATATISLCYGASVQFIPVGLAVIIFYTCPLIILVAGPAVEGVSIGVGRLATALAGFAGLVVALGPQFTDLDPRGLALAAMSALGYATQFFSGRALTRRCPPTTIACLTHLLVWPIALATVLWQGGGTLRIVDGVGVSAIGYLFVLGVAGFYIGGYLLQMLSLSNAPASTVPIFNVEPIVTTAAAAIALGERLTIHQYIGGAIVLVAVIAASRLAGSRR